MEELPAGVKLVRVLNPRPPRVSCDPSTEAPSVTLSPKLFETRSESARCQEKPTTYCGSTINGSHSFRFTMPLRFSVARLHICPAEKAKPFAKSARPNSWRCRYTYELLSRLFDVVPAPKKSAS